MRTINQICLLELLIGCYDNWSNLQSYSIAINAADMVDLKEILVDISSPTQLTLFVCLTQRRLKPFLAHGTTHQSLAFLLAGWP